MQLLIAAVLTVVTLTACGGGGESGLESPALLDNTDCAAAAAAAVDFYQPPDPLPRGRPGDLIRCQPLISALSTLSKGTLIMYLSSNVHGAPIAVTGAVFEPLRPWKGTGPRPLLGFTVGTMGQGDQCAPSRTLAEGLHYSAPLDLMAQYEVPFILDLLDQGIAVAVTDYEGFGTPGVHTYLNPRAEARANIDAVRAAQRLPGADIPAQGPVAFAGYSQGGGAAGGTAEALLSYGPELDVVGIYAGAVPRDIPELLDYLDGGMIAGVQAWYLNGLAYLYPELAGPINTRLSEAGKAMLHAGADQCIFENAVEYGYRRSSQYTVGGDSIADLLRSPALRGVVSEQRLGALRPPVPVLIGISAGDDVAPPAGAKQLAADWCALGALVEYYELPLPLIPGQTIAGHVGAAPQIYSIKAKGWLRDRFAGVPAVRQCP